RRPRRRHGAALGRAGAAAPTRGGGAVTEPPPEREPEATIARADASGEPSGEPSGEARSGRPAGRSGSPTRTHVRLDAYLANGTVLAARYRIEGILGVGGMGIVYRAHDLQLELPVALKVLRSEHASDARFRERFRRELILARQVSHRNVVRIHDLGE